MADLLLELLSEEIPARMQKRAGEDLKRLITDGLVEAGLTYAAAGAFATPRRLVLTIEGLPDESPAISEERKGPRTDAPDKAIEGFLRATGLSKDDLEVRDDKKGQVYFAMINKHGRAAAEIIASLVPEVIRSFPWPKSMRWGSGSLRWVRPLHSILCVLSRDDGSEVVPFDVDGIEASNMTAGHRFHAPQWFSVSGFEAYQAELKKSYVILDAQDRADRIWEDAKNLAFAQGLEIVEDQGLLAEVAGLVEWPVVLMGDIAEDFLGLPPEVLQTSMKEHQKFFSVKNAKTGRIEKFITVANRETADHGATILAGNQKVLFARLSDAKFFWENDLRVAKAGMDEWATKLANVTFHNKLGTQAERIERIAALSRETAALVGADPDMAEKAARLAKADLSSEMVYEFPELQGLMGRYYVEAAGEATEIAAVAEEHYSPLGPSDDVPTAPLSVAVALADKIDTLTGFWAIDEKPTGSKDPFALRRAALGVIRLVLENGFAANLNFLFRRSLFIKSYFDRYAQTVMYSKYSAGEDTEFVEMLKAELRKFSTGDFQREWSDQKYNELIEASESKGERKSWLMEATFQETLATFNSYSDCLPSLMVFIHDRLKVYLRDQGISHDVIDASIAMPGNDDLALLVARVRALQDFLKTDDGENLVQGYKRAANILAAEEAKDGVHYELDPDPKLAEPGVEADLFSAIAAAEPAITAALDKEAFEIAMQELAKLRKPIDEFFDNHQVNHQTSIIRRNRLCLLHKIRVVTEKIAIFRHLEGV
ncbi:MAG: glycine--tRNA ligase subunit beta [Pseudomonadota bacterium]